MKSTRFNMIIQIATFLFFVAVSFLSYQKNYFGFAENDFYQSFDHVSESLVLGDIIADKYGLDKNGWHLGSVRHNSADPTWDPTLLDKILKEEQASGSITFTPYPSQFGIQGILFSKIYKFLNEPNVEVLNAVNSLLMAIVISLLSVLFFKTYDRLFGVIFFVTMVSSPWTISFARNLYWVPFTWFLPAIFAVLAYISKTRAAKSIFMLFLLSAITIKSLAGYEYLTAITIFACSVFILAPLFKGEKPDFKLAFIAFLCCIAGFLLALFIHAGMRGDSIFSGLKNIYEMDVKRRTYGDPAMFDPIYKASLESNFSDVLNIYWNQWQTSILLFIPGEFLGIIFWLSVFSVCYGILARGKSFYKEPIIAFVFFTASASWYFFGKSHSYIHTQLNFVLWYFGFVQALVYCIARAALVISAGIFKRGKRLGFIIISAMSVLGVIVFVTSAKYSDSRMTKVISGLVAPIDINPGLKLIFRNDGKVLLFAQKCKEVDLTGRFIMHFFPVKNDFPVPFPYGFENRDFIWPESQRISTNWNPLSSYYGSCYTEVSLPYYKTREIRTGQYNLSKTGTITIRWEKIIPVPLFPKISELTPFNNTDQNWNNGVSRTVAGFFIANTPENRMGLSTNDKILLPSSGERTITSIEYTGKFINIYLDGQILDPALDGYPNKLLVK